MKSASEIFNPAFSQANKAVGFLAEMDQANTISPEKLIMAEKNLRDALNGVLLLRLKFAALPQRRPAR